MKNKKKQNPNPNLCHHPIISIIIGGKIQNFLLDVLELVETGLAALRRSSLFRYKLEDLTDSMSAALEPRFGFEAEPGLGDRGASDFQLEFNAEDPWPRLLLPL